MAGSGGFSWQYQLKPPPPIVPNLWLAGLSVVVGLVAGCAAVVFRWLLLILDDLFFVTVVDLLSPLAGFHRLLLPALGALGGGMVVAFLAQEARGAGVTDLVLSVLARGSRIRLRVAGVKVVGTSMVVGSGGSGGIEGPTLQIGGSLGSAIGQWAKLPEGQLRITLASGSAAAVAAMLGTPVAGLLFAHEVILGQMGWRSLVSVALSAGAAKGLALLAFGSDPLLGRWDYALTHPVELPLYLLLAVASAAVGVLFTHSFDRVDDAFRRWSSVPDCWKPVVGGLGVGFIALGFPQVMGLGYDTLRAALADQLPLALMVSLVVAKLVATTLTVGSGAPAGLIGPSLYLGGVLGGSAGILFHSLLPQTTAGSGAYALAGMAGVLAATFHAPFAAAFTAVELTGDYSLLPAVLATSLASSYLARRISPHTIYDVGLARRGIRLEPSPHRSG